MWRKRVFQRGEKEFLMIFGEKLNSRFYPKKSSISGGRNLAKSCTQKIKNGHIYMYMYMYIDIDIFLNICIYIPIIYILIQSSSE